VAEVPAVAPPYLFMAANPILPLYYNDIDRSTRDWTDAEFGCFMRLLMHQWAQGEVPKNPERMSRIVTSLAESWLTVGSKFAETETGYVNERLEQIRAERMAFSKKQSDNAKNKGKKDIEKPNESQTEAKKKPKDSLHIEYEHENKNEIRGVRGEFSEELTSMEIGATREYVSITGQRTLTEPQILEYWKAYLIHSNGTLHGTRTRQLQHFRNWLKLQPHEKSKRTNDPSKPGTVRTAV
jgi:uncharacterized protein YdaU (DUF1376 family)